jgi:hypothetical protein
VTAEEETVDRLPLAVHATALTGTGAYQGNQNPTHRSPSMFMGKWTARRELLVPSG